MTDQPGSEPSSLGGDKPFGPVAAVFLAAGIGALVLGILTTLAEASDGIASALEWSKSVGPLMGKTILAAAAFVVAWAILQAVMRGKDPSPKMVFTWTAILLAAGFVLTFPTFFQLFAPAE
ncbi:MAG TPA: hypothetical protein VF984_00220 [Actinomycetota bacterium]